MIGLSAFLADVSIGKVDGFHLPMPEARMPVVEEPLVDGGCFVPVDDSEMPRFWQVARASSSSVESTLTRPNSVDGAHAKPTTAPLSLDDQGSSCSSQYHDHESVTRSANLTSTTLPPATPTTTINNTLTKSSGAIRKRKTARTVKPLVPSRFCHICWRSSSTVRMVTCSNIHARKCRKVICEKCIDSRGSHGDFELASRPDSKWQCTHCRGICPERAQCAVYRRTNLRRRMQQKEEAQRQKQKAESSTGCDIL
eukprot:Plantae.Rhodophyta-Rhodochaete_pulchella.ctg32540.p2 GENE.Plantae.Rhodophyta-Rhodochaete_pulchella.ctg32540~~Plantae.Rhodophyta-Rhodochaete_pulchella.ctg32540.p2  ORF type:complete len:254 (+),score=12.20 Plantae.Rhodophyta-Rhodochaete_pulchella.ctg32540:253-1014(+)